MNRKAVVLLSGGLDSTLAVCIVKEQGIEVEAVNFQTMFGCCKDDARQVAQRLGVGFTLLKVGDDYLDLVRAPKYGYGRGINPCVDCRSYMFVMANNFMEKVGASFLVSGEVLDQRPMSQKLSDYRKIEAESGLEGLILRPLSAKRLPETVPERAGIVERARLYGIVGRSRKELLALAARYGIENPPSPSSGCALTAPAFAKKVRDVFDHQPGYRRWEFELLRIGRHFRMDAASKLVLGRDENENGHLEALHPDGTTLLVPLSFKGPTALLIGEETEWNLGKAGEMMLRYAHLETAVAGEIRALRDGAARVISAAGPASDALTESLRIV